MAIKFEHGGVPFTVDTPEEAAELLTILKMKEAQAAIERMRSRFQGNMKMYEHKLGAYKDENFVWTPDYFSAF